MRVSIIWLNIALLLFFSKLVHSQEETYWDDQFYVNFTYNKPVKLPKDIEKVRLSYGIGFGYLKDIPFTKTSKKGIAIGLGYAYDQIQHGFENYDLQKNITKLNTYSNFTVHSIEMPIQLRWRDSNINRHAFWRAYIGMRLSYDIKNKDNYRYYKAKDVYEELSNKNVHTLNKFRKSMELSFGYNSLNLYINYNIDKLFKESYYKDELIETRVLKLGVIFYFL